ncbi:MAG: VOC family protein [Solirubrobacteraceae bacterium]
MSPIDPSLRIRQVRLAVSDLDSSVDFYGRVMGLGLIERDANRALLGADPSDPALELTALEDPVPAPRRSTGLFHVAWLHPSRAALADTVRRIASAQWPLEGASDHGVSEALYLSDPDGLGIEIYADRPRERWERGADGKGVNMVTLPLDLEALMSSSSGQPVPTMPAGTGIGHVHLKVGDVERAEAFYSGLGFQEQARMPSAAFVSAGGYHHHVGLNSWQSAGGAPAPEESPGLRLVAFELSDQAALAALADAARPLDASAGQSDGALELRDPDGQQLRFTARES